MLFTCLGVDCLPDLYIGVNVCWFRTINLVGSVRGGICFYCLRLLFCRALRLVLGDGFLLWGRFFQEWLCVVFG